MNDRVSGYLLLGLALLLYLAGAASFVAMLLALLVKTTLAAVESAFGTMVLGVLLFVFAKKTWEAGKSRLKSTD
jgi:hypothetical protein